MNIKELTSVSLPSFENLADAFMTAVRAMLTTTNGLVETRHFPSVCASNCTLVRFNTILTKKLKTRSIKGIVLIGDWFSTKTCEIDRFDFQSLLFYINIKLFFVKTLLFCWESNIYCSLKVLDQNVLIFDHKTTCSFNHKLPFIFIFEKSC